MGYEVRAFVGRQDHVRWLALELDMHLEELSQHFALIAVTDEVLETHEGLWSYGETFWSLSEGLERAAVRASGHGPIGYMEIEMFGGVGSQATVGWSGGRVGLGPLAVNDDEAPWGPQETWPVNTMLRWMGVDAGLHDDEFESLGLGAHRSIEGWQGQG